MVSRMSQFFWAGDSIKIQMYYIFLQLPAKNMNHCMYRIFHCHASVHFDNTVSRMPFQMFWRLNHFTLPLFLHNPQHKEKCYPNLVLDLLYFFVSAFSVRRTGTFLLLFSLSFPIYELAIFYCFSSIAQNVFLILSYQRLSTPFPLLRMGYESSIHLSNQIEGIHLRLHEETGQSKLSRNVWYVPATFRRPPMIWMHDHILFL